MVGHHVAQKTFAAGVGTLWIIEVQTSKGVLKRRCWFPGRSDGPAVAALFQEIQLELQYLENVSLVVGHGCYLQARQVLAGHRPECPSLSSPGKPIAVTRLTSASD